MIVVVLWFMVRLKRGGIAWCWLVVGIALAGELLVTPTHHIDYDTVLTAPIAIGAAYIVYMLLKGIGRAWRAHLARSGAVLFSGLVFLAILLAVYHVAPIDPSYFHPVRASISRSELVAKLAPYQCILDDPADLLVYANRLTRDMRAGCPFIVDFDGVSLAQAAGITTPEARGIGATSAKTAKKGLALRAGVFITIYPTAMFAGDARWATVTGLPKHWQMYVLVGH